MIGGTHASDIPENQEFGKLVIPDDRGAPGGE